MAGRPIAVPPGWASSNSPGTLFPFDKETENSREGGREVLQIAGSESQDIPTPVCAADPSAELFA